MMAGGGGGGAPAGFGSGGAGGVLAGIEYQAGGWEAATLQAGLYEKILAKVKGAIKGQPFVKLALTLGTYSKAIDRNANLSIKWHKLSKKQKKEQFKGLSRFNKMSVLLMAYTKSGRLANRFMKNHNTLLGRLTAKFFVIFSILMLAVLAFAAISIAIDGANSPVVKMTDGVTGLQNVVNGLVIALHGEDGEGGLKGAFDLMLAAGVVFVIVALVFGATVGAIVAGALLVVGTFQLVKKKTGDTKIALLAAAAVFTLVVGALIVFFTSAGLLAVAAVLLPVALIYGAGALFWAVVTGKAPGWLAWVAGFMVMLAIIILFPLSWPVILIAAAIGLGVALLALFLRNKEKILNILKSLGDKAREWWKENKKKIITVVKWTVFFIPMLLYTIVKKIIKHKDEIIDTAVGAKDKLLSMGKAFFSVILKGIKWYVGLPNMLLNIALNGLKNIWVAIKGFWNSNIAGKITLPNKLKYIPGLEKWAGMKFPPEITAFAKGGIVTKPTLGLVGEAGPEAIIPLDKAGSMGHTFNISIDVSGVTDRSDKRALALEISDHIQREMRRWGRSPTRRAI